jgi:hypothetical protein
MPATTITRNPAVDLFQADSIHVVDWTHPQTGRHFTLVGVRTGVVDGDYEDLSDVLKFDTESGTVVAAFDELTLVPSSDAVAGYVVPRDANWWRQFWIQRQREAAGGRPDPADWLALLDELEDALFDR